MGKHIDCVDVAKIVRKKLAEKFPGCKFSVKTDRYSGGSSIRVSWIDGPTIDEVQAIVGMYHGASFDGMIDLKSYHSTTDPDSGEQVHYGNDYIFCEREYSLEAIQHFWKLTCEKFGYNPDVGTPKQSSIGAYYDFPNNNWEYRGSLNTMSHNTSLYNQPVTKEAATGVTFGEYKGHPTITLLLTTGEFSFGLTKAKAILAYIESIQQFVKEHEHESV